MGAPDRGRSTIVQVDLIKKAVHLTWRLVLAWLCGLWCKYPLQVFALTIRWVPGHHNIPGNKPADEATKEAAFGEFSAYLQLPQAFLQLLPLSGRLSIRLCSFTVA